MKCVYICSHVSLQNIGQNQKLQKVDPPQFAVPKFVLGSSWFVGCSEGPY